MDIIVKLTIGLMVAKVLYNIVSGYLSANLSKKNALKRFFGIGESKNDSNNQVVMKLLTLLFIGLAPLVILITNTKKVI